MDPIVSQHDRPRPGRVRALAVGLAAASLVVGCYGVEASPAPTTMASASPSAVSPSFAVPGGSTLAPSPSPSPSASLSVEPSASYPPGVIFEGAIHEELDRREPQLYRDSLMELLQSRQRP